jgi:hypothetical protein
MAYKVYITVELPELYYGKDAAMDAAVKALQDAVAVDDDAANILVWQSICGGAAIQARVFEEQTITSGVDHAFLVDVHDGAI